MYRLEASPAADRELEKLKGRIRRQDFERLRDAVRGLAKEPRPPGSQEDKGRGAGLPHQSGQLPGGL